MQNGETAKVRYETAPKKGTLMNDTAVRLNHLKNYGTAFHRHISSLRFRYKTNMYKHHVIIQNVKTNIQIL